MKPDLKDYFVFIGLLMLGTGIWIYDKPFSLIVVGTILLGMGLYRSIRG